jgi:hypothetical protein|nr:MAG TPA: hypothetical protein [Caudoviricetes sp.]
MANISGTNVAAPIRPFSTDDKFATAVANEIKGGLHCVDTKTTLHAIPASRRELGMLGYVAADKRFYELRTNPTGDTTDDSDWVDPLTLGNVIGTDGKTLDEKLAKVTGTTNTKHIIFNLQDAHNMGTNNVELRSPFKAAVKSIDAAVPVGAVLDTNGIEFKVEKYNTDTSNWDEVKTVKLDSTTVGNAKTEEVTGLSVAKLTRFRINIVTAMATVKNLEVIITLEVED